MSPCQWTSSVVKMEVRSNKRYSPLCMKSRRSKHPQHQLLSFIHQIGYVLRRLRIYCLYKTSHRRRGQQTRVVGVVSALLCEEILFRWTVFIIWIISPLFLPSFYSIPESGGYYCFLEIFMLSQDLRTLTPFFPCYTHISSSYHLVYQRMYAILSTFFLFCTPLLTTIMSILYSCKHDGLETLLFPQITQENLEPYTFSFNSIMCLRN